MDFQVHLYQDELERMARKAMRNKTRRSLIGPTLVQLLADDLTVGEHK